VSRTEKGAVQAGQGWFIAGTGAAPKPGEGALNLGAMEVLVEPTRGMEPDVPRGVAHSAGFPIRPQSSWLDIIAAEKKYAPYLKGLGGRADLNYLFDEMLGEVTIGHMFNLRRRYSTTRESEGWFARRGLPKMGNGRYRFARIFDGENWNPDLRAPLTQPGVDVKVGDYLLEVNGVDVRPPADVSKFLENTGDQQVRIKVASNAEGKDAREVTVVPVPDDPGLRTRAWEEDNRRKGGRAKWRQGRLRSRAGYQYRRLSELNRFLFCQVGKQAANHR